MTDIVKTQQFESIENFQKFINKAPDKSDFEINQRANNSKYIPIAVIERKLDEIYSGLWSADNFRWNTIANEIVGCLDLRVYHPTAKDWITRSGAAAVQIQLKSEKRGGSGDITNIADKIINTLQKDFPHLKAECIKNAARSLGIYFGRNLNRGTDMSEYETLSEKMEDFSENGITAIELLETSKLADNTKATLRNQISASGPEKLKSIIAYLEKNQK